MARVLRSRAAQLLAATLSIALAGCGSKARDGGNAIAGRPTGGALPVVDPSIHHDESPPLSTMMMPPEKESQTKDEHEGDILPLPGTISPSGPVADPVLQKGASNLAAPVSGAGFDGIGQGFTGPAGTFAVNSAPPDPDLAVGPSHIVQIVNSAIAVFNKSGTVLFGPTPTKALWTGFGGGCEANDDGDGVVVYDSISNRYVISQFSVSTTPFLQCVAVSTSADPTGSYFRYSFPQANFNDYPKMGVWADAYYETFNMFNGNTFLGARVCAYDRSKMLTGQAATQVCFSTNNLIGGMLPANVDGQMVPPAGAPNYVMNFTINALNLWRFHVDWTTPMSSTLTGPISVAGVAAFSAACNGGTCIPQTGTTQKLDSLADRLMYRLAYRNFGDHESLVVNHSVTAGSSVGVRWYEVRNPGGAASVFQQGTYAPDTSYRWMGSAAMDHSGDIGLAYSVSSSTLKPGIRYTGRLATAPAGTMQAEAVFFNGAGSQGSPGKTLNRWGDYSSLVIDPSDDCTFWYTNEYLAANGTFNWHTRIGSFKFTTCTGGGGTGTGGADGGAGSGGGDGSAGSGGADGGAGSGGGGAGGSAGSGGADGGAGHGGAGGGGSGGAGSGGAGSGGAGSGGAGSGGAGSGGAGSGGAGSGGAGSGGAGSGGAGSGGAGSGGAGSGGAGSGGAGSGGAGSGGAGSGGAGSGGAGSGGMSGAGGSGGSAGVDAGVGGNDAGPDVAPDSGAGGGGVDAGGPPNPPTNLSATVSDRRATSFQLSWTAPSTFLGGSVTGYQVRYAKVPITSANFDDASVSTTVPYGHTPVTVGQPDGVVVAGLYIENGYYFAVASVDAAGNRSPIVTTGNTATTAHFNVTTLSGTSGLSNELFGIQLDGSGDVNGDGQSDLLVASSNGKNAYLFLGTNGNFMPSAPSVTFTGDATAPGFGRGIGQIGDIDNDGREDIAIADTGGATPRVFIFKGRATWPAALSSANANYVISGDSSYGGSGLGGSIARLGDFNGDGIDDFAVGASTFAAGVGRVVVILGKAGFASVTLPDAVNSITIDGDASLVFPLFGAHVLGLGNFYSATAGTTLIASASGFAGLNSSAGHIYAFHGQTGSGGAIPLGSADNILTGPAANTDIGVVLSNLGPMRNSLPALGVGNPVDTATAPNGSAYVLSGDATSGPFANNSILVHSGFTRFGSVVLGGGVSGGNASYSLIGGPAPDLVLIAQPASTIQIIDGTVVNGLGTGPTDSTSIAAVSVSQTGAWANNGINGGTLIPNVNGDLYPDFAISNAVGSVPGNVDVYW